MSLYSELRRRNVHRMAVLYLGAAWLIVQVVDLLIDRGPLPDSIGPITLIVLAIGFPIALIISWFYELTPEGVSLDTDEEPAESATGFTGRRVDFVIIAVLAAALVVFAYDKWWMGPPPEQSVAVLRFVNMSAEEDSAYFSDGLADTMLHMLAQVPDLRVPARTSSFQPSLDGLDVAEIGKRLSVSTVLEGSVQLYRDKVRVTAQLIDATNGYHLWSQNFDRNFEDIFAIQDEIATEVVSALKLTLLGETMERLEREGTDNIDAYNAYLLAIRDLELPSMASFERALAHLNRATKLDPLYAHAYATLGRAYLHARGYGYMDTPEALPAAKEAAAKALDIAPDSSTALAVLGVVESVDGNRETGKLLLQKAIDKGPNDFIALSYYARYAVEQQAEKDAIYRRLVEIDPLAEGHHVTLAWRLRFQRKVDEALQVIARFKEANPFSADMPYVEGFCYMDQGKYAAAVQAMRAGAALDDKDMDFPWQLVKLYLLMDMPEEARHWVDRAIEIDPAHPVSRAMPILFNYYLQQNEEENVRLARNLLIDRLSNRRGSVQTAIEVLIEYKARSGRHEVPLELLDNLAREGAGLFSDADFMANYYNGLVLLQSGDTARGTQLMREFLKRLEQQLEQFEGDLLVGPHDIVGRLALGETEVAMAKLRKFANTKSKWIYGDMDGLGFQTQLKHSALFDPIRDEPEFIELLKEYKDNAAEQRRLVQEMDVHQAQSE